ncbi:hypothetical protein FGB62_186g019 [Gracilaria domingensis]|nr:hypothetical protein FGB62_186g019 [Gracilaria domingensis]
MAFRSWIGTRGGHDATARTKLSATASLVDSDDAEEAAATGAAPQAGLAASKRRSALAGSARDTGWGRALAERTTAAGGTAGAWRRSAARSGARWPAAGTLQSAGEDMGGEELAREGDGGGDAELSEPAAAARGAGRRGICSAPTECTARRSHATHVMWRAAYNSGRRGEGGGRTAQARATQRQCNGRAAPRGARSPTARAPL